MKTLLLLLSTIWPFHHHTAPSTPEHATSLGVMTREWGLVHFDDSSCPKLDDGRFVFIGPDGLLGMSLISCDEAFVDWSHGPAVKALLHA